GARRQGPRRNPGTLPARWHWHLREPWTGLRKDTPAGGPGSGWTESTALLEEALADGLIRNDAPLDEPLAVTAAAGAQPLLVEPQHVLAGAERRPLADVGEHV